MEKTFSLDEALEPETSIDGLIIGEESAKAMSPSLLETAFVVNILLILADSLPLLETIDDLPSEFDLFELILANRRYYFSCWSDLHRLRHLLLLFCYQGRLLGLHRIDLGDKLTFFKLELINSFLKQ